MTPTPEKLRDRQSRLEALWDLALADRGAPETQLHAVLDDALDALAADYAEFGYSAEDGFVVVSSVGTAADGSATEIAIGSGVGATEGRAVMIFDTLAEHNGTEQFPFRSILAWPFAAAGKRCSLGFAWKTVRESFISEDEIRYIEFLARVISRLLEIVDYSRELSAKIATDTLTGLRNRHATMEQIDTAISSAARGGTRAAVLYIDLDGFKEVNDTRGHAFGDAVLAETGKRLSNALRKHEFAGRIGGDEFAVVIPHFASDEELAEVAKRIARNIRQPITESNQTVELQASIGIAAYPDDAKEAPALLHAADQAMYEAKRRRSQIVFAGHRRISSAPAVALASSEGESEPRFILCYQPIVDARTGKTIALEALIRLIDAEGNVNPPAAFLAAAVQNGSASAVDRDILGVMTTRMKRFKTADTGVSVHVNLREANEELLRLDGDLSGLAFELREDAIAANFEVHGRFIDTCRARGIRVGITNFGCGGLSLRLMSTLDIDFVKLGRELVRSGEFGSRAGVAARAAIDTAHRFGWLVIAENVEDAMLREWFIANGADALQGYAICSPLTGPDVGEWLKYHRSA